MGGVGGVLTPPLFLALTCSIVLSAFLDVELENPRAPPKPLAIVPDAWSVCGQAFWVLNAWTGPLRVIARRVAGLSAEEKVRRAGVRSSLRIAGAFRSCLAARTRQLHDEDIRFAGNQAFYLRRSVN